MAVRFAEEQDLDEVMEIEKLSFSNPWDSEFLINISKNIFLVYGKHQIRGFLIAGCCHRNINATILKVAVHPEHRRKGIATSLLYKLFKILKDKHIVEVDVFVKGVWGPAMWLYKKLGFNIISRVPQASDSEDFCLMKLKLT
jgi:ribosomal-protein-alanine N-acetyltransferase